MAFQRGTRQPVQRIRAGFARLVLSWRSWSGSACLIQEFRRLKFPYYKGQTTDMFRIFRQSQQMAQETQICRYHDHHSMYNLSKVVIQTSLLIFAPKLAFSYYLLPGWKSLTCYTVWSCRRRNSLQWDEWDVGDTEIPRFQSWIVKLILLAWYFARACWFSFSPNSVLLGLLGVLNAFLRCPPWCWTVCPPSRGSCLPLAPIVCLLVSLCLVSLCLSLYTFLFLFVGWCVRLPEGHSGGFSTRLPACLPSCLL